MAARLQTLIRDATATRFTMLQKTGSESIHERRRLYARAGTAQ